MAVLPTGLDREGMVYRSLLAVAQAVTGAHWNGHFLIGIQSPSRSSPATDMGARRPDEQATSASPTRRSCCAVRDLHAQEHRGGTRLGVQHARRPARERRGVHHQPAARELGVPAGSLRRRRLHGRATDLLHQIWMAPGRAAAEESFDLFCDTYEAKYSKPAAGLAMVFKLRESASKKWPAERVRADRQRHPRNRLRRRSQDRENRRVTASSTTYGYTSAQLAKTCLWTVLGFRHAAIVFTSAATWRRASDSTNTPYHLSVIRCWPDQ